MDFPISSFSFIEGKIEPTPVPLGYLKALGLSFISMEVLIILTSSDSSLGAITIKLGKVDKYVTSKLPAYVDHSEQNINNNSFNAGLTLIIIFLTLLVIPPALDWMILEATISGDTKEACVATEGACWTYIKVWFRRFMYGMYPNDFHWRINTAFIVLIAFAFVGYFMRGKLKNYITFYYAILYPIIAFVIINFLISGGSFGLEWVETNAWGGLSLTFIVSFFGLIFCFPLGMILALGRRSELPVIRYISIGYIEFWRGVPLSLIHI